MNCDPGEKDAFKDLDFFFFPESVDSTDVFCGLISLFSYFLSVRKEKEQKTFCV